MPWLVWQDWQGLVVCGGVLCELELPAGLEQHEAVEGRADPAGGVDLISGVDAELPERPQGAKSFQRVKSLGGSDPHGRGSEPTP